jgi:hypothetical protein
MSYLSGMTNVLVFVGICRAGAIAPTAGRSCTWTLTMPKFLSLVYLLLALAVPYPANAADIPLPPLVPDRIGRAQIFVGKIKDKRALQGKRDIIWGDQGEKLPDVYSLKYMQTDRDPDRTHDVAWYKINHPDWLVYQNDRESPAHEFKYDWGYNTPVDITNPEVREYLFEVNLKSTLGTGRYESIAIDNVFCTNDWHRAGVWQEGIWRQQYQGAKVDPVFARDVADWMKWLAERAHAAGMSLSANHYPKLDDEAGYRLIANELDIIVDEHGYTRKGKPMFTDEKWRQYVSLFADLAQTKPIVVIDQLTEGPDPPTPAVINWALANYLLMKGDRTYVAWPMDNGYGRIDEYPELYLPIGRPLESFVGVGDVFQRRFEKAIAIVNPASKASATYQVPPGKWRDLAGSEHSGIITLPPASGLVLSIVSQP